MELSVQSIKKTLHDQGIHLSRLRGQNFLISQEVVRQLMTAAQIKKTGAILEVGPGLGILTKELVKSAKEVWAVEIDRKLYQVLTKTFSSTKNLKLFQEDVLKLHSQLTEDLPNGYQVVSNLPFQITSHFLRLFLEGSNKPKQMTLIVQQELGERICACPGKMSLISVAVQFFGRPEIVKEISQKNFWPSPKVDTVILKISDIGQGYSRQISQNEIKKFFRLVRIGFSARRKQLQNNLAAGLGQDKVKIQKKMAKIGLDSAIRPQKLSVSQWIALVKVI